ncbi:terminase small subunit [Aliarcobacter lanthieri]|uniref:terminase small subunit n=1 Tax=Aliarcobacter lanthieri TaxID=1355374 RepID=UPI003AB0BF9C
MAKLTPKQELFSQTYVKTGNASESYKTAYNVKSTNENTINVKASRLLKESKINLRVKQLQSDLSKRHDISKDKIIKHLCSVAFFDIARVSNEDGSIKRINELDKDTRILLNGVIEKTIGAGKKAERTVSYRMSEKLKALDMLIRLLGYNEPDKVEHSGDVLQNIKFIDVDKLSPKEVIKSYLDLIKDG